MTASRAELHREHQRRWEAKNPGYAVTWRRTPRGMFSIQRSNALKRGIQWELTFEQWLTAWGDKLEKRGTGRNNYVMARYGDAGPYAAGNVYICTALQNSTDRKVFPAKLAEQDVPYVRHWLRTGFLQREVAAAFGVNPSVISRINTGHVWREA